MQHVCCLFIANAPDNQHELLTDSTSVPTGDCRDPPPSSALFTKNHTFPRTGATARGAEPLGCIDVQTLQRRRAVIRRMSRAVSREPFETLLSIHNGGHIDGDGGNTGTL